jgi:spore germination cell wall hydrolase CwlJ-like protein
MVGTFGSDVGGRVPAPGLVPAPGEFGTAPSTAAAGRVMSGADRASSIDCLATAIAYEAGNEPQAGKQAVAQVVLNRARHKAFPKTVCSVVYQGSGRRTGCQFTFTCDGSLRRVLSRRVWASAQAVAIAAVDGQLPPTIGLATHYHADYVLPRWAPAMARIGQIGAHIFYRFPGDGGGQSGSLPVLTAERARSGSPPRGNGPAAFTAWGLVPVLPAAAANSNVSPAS